MSRIPSVRAYLGPEEGLRADTIGELRSFIKRETAGEIEEHRLYLPEDSLESAMSLLRNGSLFGEHQLVLLRGAEQIRKKAEVELVRAFCERPPEAATLVLISEAARLDAKLEKVIPGDARKVFWELFENQKRGWVQGYFKTQNVPVTSEALELFLDLVENNTQELRAEADKLVTFVRAQQTGSGSIGVEEVETYVYHSRGESVFSLHRKLVTGDLDGVLSVLQKILGSGEGNPAQLIGGLAFQTRRIIALRMLVENGFSLDEAFRKVNVRGKRIQADYRDAMNRFDTRELQHQLELLVATETATREMGSALHTLLLELLCYRLLFPGAPLAPPLEHSFVAG